MDDRRIGRPLTRRTFAGQAARVLAACWCAPLWVSLSGCSGNDTPDEAEPAGVPVALLPLDRRVKVDLGGRPVEFLRTEAGISARSLLCTHQGCEVEWRPGEEAYVCPCHDGRFDAGGRPVYGMPRRPLATLPVNVVDGRAVLGE